jgi:hypothetical protein
MRALEKDQKRRFATAAAMMEECQSALTVLSTGPFRVLTPLHAQGTPGSGFASAAAPGAITRPGGGPPPPQPHAAMPSPRPGAAAFDRPTVLEGHAPILPPNVSPVAAVAASAKTVLVSSAQHMEMLHHPTPPPAPMPAAGPNRTVLLPNSEGIVSMRPPTPPPMHALDRIGYQEGARSGASALFWIFCLLAGLAVGVGAYWLVLELGK